MKNITAKYLLEETYGKGCMFRKADIAKRIEVIGGIKTYKKFVHEQRYKGKIKDKLESRLTYHHLQHRFEGGETNMENGAEINELAHRYIHSLPREQEEVINNMLRQYKIDFNTFDVSEQGINIQEYNTTDTLSEEYIEIPVYDIKDKEEYNRAKEKEITRQLIDRYYEER